MNHLLRELAPISRRGWELLDREARERLEPALAARKLVDFSGPHGWEYSATNLGRSAALSSLPAEGVAGEQRLVLPLVEARADFEVSRAELAAADRGADDVDLQQLDAAAHRIAAAENRAVFHGWAGVFDGVSATSPHEQLQLGAAADEYPPLIATAVGRMLSSGIAGPYGLALAPEPYQRVIGTAEPYGYPLLDHLGKILGGPIVWTPGIDGGAVVSLRGGDLVFESGQDLSIGYDSHDSEVVRLYLQESFSFRVATPEAAVSLKARSARKTR